MKNESQFYLFPKRRLSNVIANLTKKKKTDLDL